MAAIPAKARIARHSPHFTLQLMISLNPALMRPQDGPPSGAGTFDEFNDIETSKPHAPTGWGFCRE